MENNNKTKKPMSHQEMVNGLLHPTIPIDPFGAMYRESTSTLASQIVDLFANTFKIPEVDHVVISPLKDKSQKIYSFILYVYFDTKRAADSQYWTIRKINGGGSKGLQSNNGKIDLRPIAGTRMGNGGFELSDHFKSTLGPLAVKDDDQRIIVNAVPEFKNVAVVEFNFFKVFELCLGILPSDNYDFAVIDCVPVRTSNSETTDYILTFTKEICLDNVNRRGRNGIDYSRSDARIIKNAGGR